MASHAHIVSPREGYSHTHTIVFLHGKGSDAEEFSSEFFESEATEPAGQPRTLPDLFPSIRWVFPSAPILRSERFDCEESQWFDMWAVENPNERPEMQLSGLSESIKLVQRTIEEEERLLPADRIFLGGISQGFATVYAHQATVATTRKLGGLIGLCSWAPSAAVAALSSSSASQESHQTPVFLGHAKDDNVIPFKEGVQLREVLAQTAGPLEWHEYEDALLILNGSGYPAPATDHPAPASYCTQLLLPASTHGPDVFSSGRSPPTRDDQRIPVAAADHPAIQALQSVPHPSRDRAIEGGAAPPALPRRSVAPPPPDDAPAGEPPACACACRLPAGTGALVAAVVAQGITCFVLLGGMILVVVCTSCLRGGGGGGGGCCYDCAGGCGDGPEDDAGWFWG
ncbi:Phospholipase/Carboxylesterase-domain-containing protein [Xylariomycetidae sp. FL0641]|nr:Phospholipase/Carboxylesterase-domain-containing protein [Xylariomycetidae sp. FL0641]